MSKFTISMDTTAPTGAGTTTIFSSVSAFGAKMIRHLKVKRISFAVENDQAGTLEASRSTDGGTTWDVFDSRAVAAAGANVISGPYDYLIDTYEDFRLRWTNGGSNQTTWRPELHGHEDRVPGT